MKVLDFLKDKIIFILFNIITFIVVSMFMFLGNINFVVIFNVFCIWFLPITIYFIIEFIKWRRYFNSIEYLLENLDKKYLLPEVLEESGFIIGERFNDILKELSRDMHENINYYKNMQIDYREYIETWIHEIKTPIASSKLIIENNKNQITDKIDIQIDKIENFIEQVLYYSRSDNANKDYIVKETNLKTIVNNVVKKNCRDFISKKIKINISDINKTVYVDTKWAEFIINQIVINSIKYSKEKEAHINIYSIEKPNAIVLTIEDNGAGIIESDINKVFEKGFTGENGRKFGKSTGIGLYLCKKLCDKLGLNISIKSKLNQGTKVNIVFPKGKLL